jgi:hypothetical protein
LKLLIAGLSVFRIRPDRIPHLINREPNSPTKSLQMNYLLLALFSAVFSTSTSYKTGSETATYKRQAEEEDHSGHDHSEEMEDHSGHDHSEEMEEVDDHSGHDHSEEMEEVDDHSEEMEEVDDPDHSEEMEDHSGHDHSEDDHSEETGFDAEEAESFLSSSSKSGLVSGTSLMFLGLFSAVL